MTEEDWNVLVSKEIEYANKIEPGSGLQIGLMWMNQGPSGGGDIPGKRLAIAGLVELNFFSNPQGRRLVQKTDRLAVPF